MKLFLTIAKLGFTKILSMFQRDCDETIFMYSEYDSKNIMTTCTIESVYPPDVSTGLIIKRNISAMTSAFM
jgi:hypothetical protein